jgi:hypothetical protein
MLSLMLGDNDAEGEGDGDRDGIREGVIGGLIEGDGLGRNDAESEGLGLGVLVKVGVKVGNEVDCASLLLGDAKIRPIPIDRSKIPKLKKELFIFLIYYTKACLVVVQG